MSIKTLAEIPTLTQLYAKSALKAASTPAKAASTALNDRVGLIRGDITKLSVHAIVNAANGSLLGGGGVDGAIHRAAGPDLREECRELDGCATGMAKITSGCELPARYVIHTVGPVYFLEGPDESKRLLESCYKQSLRTAVKNGVQTVAFSAISTGAYGYPSDDAAEVACRAVHETLSSELGKTLQRVVFVTFEEKDVDAYNSILPKYFPPAESKE